MVNRDLAGSMTARAAPVLARFRTLRRDDLEALDRSVAALAAAEGRHHRSDLGFHFAWYKGPPLDRLERDALGDLFRDVCTAVTMGVTGFDASRLRSDRRPGIADVFGRWLTSPSRRDSEEDAALTLLDAACRPFDSRRAIVACWNVACAVTMRDHLEPAVVAELEAGWRGALGEPPGPVAS